MLGFAAYAFEHFDFRENDVWTLYVRKQGLSNWAFESLCFFTRGLQSTYIFFCAYILYTYM